MENIFEKDGVLVKNISIKARNYYAKQEQCPNCNCLLQVFKTAWKKGKFICIKGKNTRKFKIDTYVKCPICGVYLNQNFKVIEDVKLYKDL